MSLCMNRSVSTAFVNKKIEAQMSEFCGQCQITKTLFRNKNPTRLDKNCFLCKVFKIIYKKSGEQKITFSWHIIKIIYSCF